MEIKIMLDKGAFPPTRAHHADAGLDLYTPVGVYVDPYGEAIVDTGVHMDIPFGFYGKVCSKSGLFFKHDLFTDGTIDSGYTGTIKVKIVNFSEESYYFGKGEKVAQLVITRCELPELVVVEKIATTTERGNDGFGSTGK